MADSRYIVELEETIEKMNVELSQSHTKISELDAKVREQEDCLSTAQEEMSNLREENARLARDLKESEEKCRAVQEILDIAEQKLAQLSQKPETATEECLAQVNESNDDALGINSLPDEIIAEVFGYLMQNQLGQIARVCRRWNVLTKSPVLWRKVNVKIFPSVREKNTVAKSFINGLPSCVTFMRLDFTECEDVDFEELSVKLHQNCPRLEELILAHCVISNILPEIINFCTQFLQCVKKLVFHYCCFSNFSRTVELNDNSKIEVLDLYCCDLTHSIKTQFSKLLYLKELRLPLTNGDVTRFVDDASFLNRLHVLDLGWTKFTASTFLAIQRHGHNLKELYLCCVNNLNFTDSEFPHLKTICLFNHLSCFSVTCETVVSLIQSCPTLENVYVNETVADAFAAHPVVVANRCESGIVKAIDYGHKHKVNYSHN